MRLEITQFSPLRRACVFWQDSGHSVSYLWSWDMIYPSVYLLNLSFAPNTWLCLNSGIFTRVLPVKKMHTSGTFLLCSLRPGGSATCSREHKETDFSVICFFRHVNRYCSPFPLAKTSNVESNTLGTWNPVLTNSVETEPLVFTRSLHR